MGFFTGRVTCTRFRVDGAPLRTFGIEHLEMLDACALGRQATANSDGSQVGWIAGDHILDTRFDLAKNVVNDTLQFAMRVDEIKIPGDLLRAYTQVEIDALAAGNPSGFASSKQKREARQVAKDRLEHEARDGRFLRRRSIPVLWDAPSSELLVGTTSVTALDRLHPLFQQTFDRKFEMLGAGRQAFALAEVNNQMRSVDDATPTAFVASQSAQVSWVADETSRDYFGNEFLLWLWFTLDNESDTLKLMDKSEVAVMITKSLTLECPRGQTGKETISSDGPTRLPEALRAIQTGKLPRKAGMILVRHDEQYELTLQPETMTIGSAKLPAAEGESDQARLEDRVTKLRHLLETLDLMYAAFLNHRLSDGWKQVEKKMKHWLQREERKVA